VVAGGSWSGRKTDEDAGAGDEGPSVLDWSTKVVLLVVLVVGPIVVLGPVVVLVVVKPIVRRWQAEDEHLQKLFWLPADET
jgi:hypothetical protein